MQLSLRFPDKSDMTEVAFIVFYAIFPTSNIEPPGSGFHYFHCDTNIFLCHYCGFCASLYTIEIILLPIADDSVKQ